MFGALGENIYFIAYHVFIKAYHCLLDLLKVIFEHVYMMMNHVEAKKTTSPKKHTLPKTNLTRVFPKMEENPPKWMVYNGKTRFEIDDFGGTPIFGNIHTASQNMVLGKALSFWGQAYSQGLCLC